MYNLRYHVASLVAVFLALAVGLLLGTVVAERGMLTDRSTALVEDLRKRFDEITAANAELREGLQRDRAFAEEVEPLLLAGALEGRNVAIVVGTGRVDGLGAAQDALAAAGAAPSLVTLVRPGLRIDAPAREVLAAYFASRGETAATDDAALVEQVATALAAEWQRPGDRTLTALLVDQGLVQVEGIGGDVAVDSVVVMAADADGGCDPFARALADAYRASGGTAVAAEASYSEGGVAQSCAAEGLSAVDHLSTPQGRFSLVWLLAGRAEGYYGTGDGADGYYPRLD